MAQCEAKGEPLKAHPQCGRLEIMLLHRPAHVFKRSQTGETSYSFELGTDSPNDFDMYIYEMDSLRDLAIEFVEEGLFGDIPKNIQSYLDYDISPVTLA